VRARKPEAAFWDYIERSLALVATELLLVDNSPDIIASARSRGWYAVLWTSTPQCAEAIREITGDTEYIGRTL